MIKIIFLSILGLHLWTLADELSPKVYPVKAGATLQYYRYVEPALISHTGFFIGAWVDFDYEVPIFSGKVQADLLSGQLNYDGAICDISTTPNTCRSYKAKTNDLIFKVAHRLAFQVTDQFDIFAGLGYRYLYDKGDGPGFYARTGQYIYAPVGFTVKHQLSDDRGLLNLDFEYATFLSGVMESQLSNVNRSYSDVKHKQNKGSVVRISLGFAQTKQPDDLRPWFYSAYFEQWSIAKSDEVELLINGVRSGKSIIEPENFSESIGIKVGFGY